MLRSLKDLEYYDVSATDGDIGKVVNFLLDDEAWTVRYLVVKTGGFFGGRRVLISPIAFRQAEWTTQCFELALTRTEVKDSPDIDLDKPVSRQNERLLHHHYGHFPYWGDSAEDSSVESNDVHLRSANELRGYHIQGSDGKIGHVEDFIVDDQSWQVRYLVIDTSNWWFGKKALIAPHWASRIDLEAGTVSVDMSRKMIRSSPEWNATTAAINRDFEARLYDYYGRPIYWDSGDRLVVASPARPEIHDS